MSIKIAILKETAQFEKRVAATPETVKKLAAIGCEIAVETGAGIEAGIPDESFAAAGASIAKTFDAALKDAAIVLKVQAPFPDELARIENGAVLIGLLNPYMQPTLVPALANAGIDAFTMEFVPRISRAQGMDVLSSQSSLAGYKAVLDAAAEFGKAFPMMMTAAGTIPPAKIFVMGAGVAGLQAIATARRLGAVVSATDVRPAAKEQVKSLGAAFIAVEDEEFKQAESAAGYAKPMSPQYQAKQQTLIEETIQKQDIVIATALIPGRPAPRLISEVMVRSMKPGSVIVDLAVETGGNCALSQPAQVVEVNGVKILGHINVPSHIAGSAAPLYAKNILNFLTLILDPKTGAPAVKWDDDIIKATALTRGGAIVHSHFVGKG